MVLQPICNTVLINVLIDQAPMTKKVPHRTPQNYKVKMAEKHVGNMLRPPD